MENDTPNPIADGDHMDVAQPPVLHAGQQLPALTADEVLEPDVLRLFAPFVCGGTIAMCLLANLLVPGLFWNATSSRVEYLAIAACGGLSAQLGIVAMWCAIGLGTFRWRLLGTTLLALLVSCSYIGGLRIPDRSSSGLPLFAALFILGIGIGGFLIASGAFALLFWLSAEKIVQPAMQSTSEPEDVRAADQRFSIGYLIGITTIVAIGIALVKGILPEINDDRPPAVELIIVSVLVTMHAVVSMLIVVSCAVLVLRKKGNYQGAIWLACCLFFAVPADLFCMSQFSGRFGDVDGEVIAMLYSYAAGLTIISLIFLLIMRASGCRLVCYRSRLATDA